MSQISFSWDRLRPAFYRRYKWAFEPEYDRIRLPVVAPPSLARLMPACTALFDVSNRFRAVCYVLISFLPQEEFFSPADSIATAEMILNGLLESGTSGGWAGLWAGDRIKVSYYI